MTEPDLEALLGEAAQARENAYAPYSRFFVGAAAATDAGVFRGANVENASYPVGVCAERVAVAAAIAAGAARVDAVAVAGSAEEPTPPCGQCRQFLHEFNPRMAVAARGTAGATRRWTLDELLPDAFGPDAPSR